MGIDLTRLGNHSLIYTNAEEMLQQLTAKTGLPVRIIPEKDWGKGLDDYTGWVIHTEDEKTVQQLLDEKDLITIVGRPYEPGQVDLHLNPFVHDYYSDAFYIGRWHQMKYLADSIREHGLPLPKDYSTHSATWQLQQRKNYYEACQPLGTTASVIFCGDVHEDWLDYFTDEAYTLEQFVEWGKRDFIFVSFQDLERFTFPSRQLDYYNVFIYDDFEDLKA